MYTGFEQLKPQIEGYLKIKIPRDWDDWSITRRRDFLSGRMNLSEELFERKRVCAKEIYYDVYSQEKDTHLPVDDKILCEINKAISAVWNCESKSVRTKLYGVQRGFVLAETEGLDENRINTLLSNSIMK